MYRYKVTMKNGTVVEAEDKWLDTDSIHRYLCNTDPFIHIGKTVLSKDTIAVIQRVEEEKLETTEKEIF